MNDKSCTLSVTILQYQLGSETLHMNSAFTWLITHEDFICQLGPPPFSARDALRQTREFHLVELNTYLLSVRYNVAQIKHFNTFWYLLQIWHFTLR